MIPGEIRERLRCPQCGASLLPDDPVTCAAGHPLVVRDGFVDALPADRSLDANTDRMFSSFGFQHTRLERHPPEDVHVWRRYFRDVPFERLKGAIGLDAGCGSGRFSRFLAGRLGALVALDGSPAVRAAAHNLREWPDVVVVRADLRSAPLAAASFDFICCIGVLHHLTDPRGGFRSLVRLLSPGGYLLIFVYSRPQGGTRKFIVAAGTAIRRVSVHLPPRVLRTVSAPIAGVLYVAFVLPGRIGDRLPARRLSRLPLRMYRRLPFHSLLVSVFDELSAPLERRYLWSDVEPWFREAGLIVDSVRDDDGLVILARSPR